METFKVGDKVKIIDSEGLFFHFKCYVGQMATITHRLEGSCCEHQYLLDRDGGNALWVGANFVLVDNVTKDDKFIKDVNHLLAIIRDKAESLGYSIDEIRDIRYNLNDLIDEFENRHERLIEEINELESYLEDDDK